MFASLLLVLVLAPPSDNPFDPPPGPLPWQVVNMPELGETDDLPTLEDLAEPELSAAYAAKLAETEDKLAAIEEAATSLTEAGEDLAGLLPASSGDDFDAGLDFGDQSFTAYEFATEAGSAFAETMQYGRATLEFLGATGQLLMWAMIGALWLLALTLIEIAFKVIGNILVLLLKAAGIIPGWLFGALKLVGGLFG